MSEWAYTSQESFLKDLDKSCREFEAVRSQVATMVPGRFHRVSWQVAEGARTLCSGMLLSFSFFYDQSLPAGMTCLPVTKISMVPFSTRRPADAPVEHATLGTNTEITTIPWDDLKTASDELREARPHGRRVALCRAAADLIAAKPGMWPEVAVGILGKTRFSDVLIEGFIRDHVAVKRPAMLPAFLGLLPKLDTLISGLIK